MTKVAILDIEANKVVYEAEVNLEGLNYVPGAQELYDLAWESAVEDEVVNDGDRQKYRFQAEYSVGVRGSRF